VTFQSTYVVYCELVHLSIFFCLSPLLVVVSTGLKILLHTEDENEHSRERM
jgi:hypothetical protein